MRGEDLQQHNLFSYGSLEEKIPQMHPLRPIRTLVDEALGRLSRHFSRLYAPLGRPSIAPEKLLRTLYRLTPAEAGVALLLASGRSISEISETCSYTVETVRWYSKQILGKTGCRNRAELVRELSTVVTSAIAQRRE